MMDKMEDNYIDRLKRSRGRPAEWKIKLSYIRSSAPESLVLVFESDEDNLVYSQWIRRTEVSLEYESICCRSKRQVLEFRDSLQRDQTGIKGRIGFLVDRDFDDFSVFSPSEETFMTDRYSIENYLASDECLSELLRSVFPCNGYPKERREILGVYQKVFSEFCDISKEINFRLFVSVKLNIMIPRGLDDRISNWCTIEFDRVTCKGTSPAALVPFATEPTEEQIRELRACFQPLDPHLRYRGKWIYRFFLAWLQLLVDEFATRSTQILSKIDKNSRVRQNEFTMGKFSSKCPIPNGLEEFLRSVQGR